MQAVDVVAVAACRAQALVDRDWAAVREQLHPEFVYTTASGHRLGRDDYLDFLEHGPLRWHEQRLDLTSVVVDGDTAVLAGDVLDDVTIGEERTQLRFATTQIYVCRDGKWLYLSGHTSKEAG
jgi:hypothetical protein